MLKYTSVVNSCTNSWYALLSHPFEQSARLISASMWKALVIEPPLRSVLTSFFLQLQQYFTFFMEWRSNLRVTGLLNTRINLAHGNSQYQRVPLARCLPWRGKKGYKKRGQGKTLRFSCTIQSQQYDRYSTLIFSKSVALTRFEPAYFELLPLSPENLLLFTYNYSYPYYLELHIQAGTQSYTSLDLKIFAANNLRKRQILLNATW